MHTLKIFIIFNFHLFDGFFNTVEPTKKKKNEKNSFIYIPFYERGLG